MTCDSASQFIANMNSAGYLGQAKWQLPPVDSSCGAFNCSGTQEPMGELFYGQFGLREGTPVVAVPNITVGPLHNLQPYLYWSCYAAKIQDPCDASGMAPNFEWSFSFGNGFEGMDLLRNDLYVTAYFVGSRSSSSGPVIAEVANAVGRSQRHGERKERVRVLHQPHADQHSHTSRCYTGPGASRCNK